MRERVFAILGDRCVGARVLDLCAGTGAILLEAMSRGAIAATAVERNPRMVDVLRANLESFGLEARGPVTVQRSSWRPALARLRRQGVQFDLVWADPPFEDWREGLEAAGVTMASGLLHPDGTFCLECPSSAVVDADSVSSLSLHVERDVVGGASRVVILRASEQPAEPVSTVISPPARERKMRGLE